MSDVVRKGITVLFEIDTGTDEATGTVHPFCSAECRDRFPGEPTPGTVFEAGLDQLWVDDLVCETCGRTFEEG